VKCNRTEADKPPLSPRERPGPAELPFPIDFIRVILVVSQHSVQGGVPLAVPGDFKSQNQRFRRQFGTCAYRVWGDFQWSFVASTGSGRNSEVGRSHCHAVLRLRSQRAGTERHHSPRSARVRNRLSRSAGQHSKQRGATRWRGVQARSQGFAGAGVSSWKSGANSRTLGSRTGR
jgi:hypothetical protein